MRQRLRQLLNAASITLFLAALASFVFALAGPVNLGGAVLFIGLAMLLLLAGLALLIPVILLRPGAFDRAP